MKKLLAGLILCCVIQGCLPTTSAYVLKGPEANEALPYAKYLRRDTLLCRSAVKIPIATTPADACE